jgi:membrane-anchored glycerophosphoryl diester phosphodiesterase (GDPDase)
MQSFSRGWSFLTQAWQMAFKDKDLIKPSIYALVVGFIVSIIGIIPIVGAYLLFGESGIGQVLTFALGALMVFINFVVTYIFSGMTAYLIYGYLSEGDGRMDHAWAIVRRDFFDLLTLAAASTAVNLIKSMAQRRSRRGGGNILAGLARSATGLLEVLWTEASFLILPAMVIDDLNLKDGIQRVWDITKSNLLLIGISTVGVRWVTGLIGFVLGVIGAVIGFGVGYGLIAVLGTGVAGLVIGIGLGAMIFFAFTLVASVIGSYTGIAYHTCLYIWAREAEKAQVAGQPIQVAAPAPLAAVLG